MRDFKLTADGELDLTAGLALVEDLEQLEQNLRSRLRTFYGEWVFDTSRGVKYYEEILVKSPDLSVVEGILKATILETAGVVELTEFSMDFDVATRNFTVTAAITTEYGTVYLEEALP